MKKIYSIIIAVLVGLTFESGASSGESSKSIWCKGAALQCRRLGGITRYQKNGCQDMGDRQVLSKCYLTFCKLNCQALPGKGCPTGAVLDKCKEVCGSLYYGNEAIHNDIAECVGDKMLTLPETRAMKIRLDTQKVEAGETTNLSQVKKWLDYIKRGSTLRKRTYIAVELKQNFTNLSKYLIDLTEKVQAHLDRGQKNYSQGYPKQVNEAKKLAYESCGTVTDYTKSILALREKIDTLKANNDALNQLNGGAPFVQGAKAAEAGSPLFSEETSPQVPSTFPPLPVLEQGRTTSPVPSAPPFPGSGVDSPVPPSYEETMRMPSTPPPSPVYGQRGPTPPPPPPSSRRASVERQATQSYRELQDPEEKFRAFSRTNPDWKNSAEGQALYEAAIDARTRQQKPSSTDESRKSFRETQASLRNLNSASTSSVETSQPAQKRPLAPKPAQRTSLYAEPQALLDEIKRGAQLKSGEHSKEEALKREDPRVTSLMNSKMAQRRRSVEPDEQSEQSDNSGWE